MLDKVLIISVKKLVMYYLLTIKQLHAPSEIYADFESNLKWVQTPNRDNSDISCTGKYQDHIVFSYGK